MTNHRPGSSPIGVGVEAILAFAQNRDGGVGSVNFETIVVTQVPHTQKELALGEADLREVVVQAEEAKARLRTHSQDGVIQMQFGASVGIGPQVISGGERPVDHRGTPIVRAGRLHGNISSDVIQIRHTRRRVLCVRGQHEQGGKSCGE